MRLIGLVVNEARPEAKGLAETLSGWAAARGASVRPAPDGFIVNRARQVLAESVELLERVADDGLFAAIAEGTFGVTKRPADGGQLGSGRRRLHRIGGSEVAIPLGDVHRHFLRPILLDQRKG